MSDFLDRLPSTEREKIRKRLRTPEAYEALRESVKGPEDLEKELRKSEQMAELHFRLESEPRMHDQLKAAAEKDLREQGMERVLEGDISPESRAKIAEGEFRIAVQPHPLTHQDALGVVPEGTVQEVIAFQPSFSEQYAAQMSKTA